MRGFTLIELMFVVAILGLLAVVAVGAYTRQVRNAHKSEVIADLSNLTLRQKSFLAVSGHYASSTDCDGPTCTYPDGATITAASGEVPWNVNDVGYTRAGVPDGPYFRGGGDVHGFDALRFMPEGGRSHCGYATVSGWGTTADDGNDDEPPNSVLSREVFPDDPGIAPLYARDWFYSYALCDFDHDGVYWAFTTAHSSSDISSNSTADNQYREGE